MKLLDQSENWYVCSLIVQAKPAKLAQVQEDILKIPYAEIHGVKPEEGKIIVTIESDRQLALADRIDEVKDINGVIVVSLISNYIDEP
ncbi:chaperone NapD [Pasteurellaceae bacterium 22721_9_1]